LAAKVRIKNTKNCNITADFETTTDKNDCRVWAVGVCEITEQLNFSYDNNIKSFIDNMLIEYTGNICYFHNLKFDGEFILIYLLENGWQHFEQEDLPNEKDHYFTTLITEDGAWYSITLWYSNNIKVEIRDSMKLLNFSVEKIAKDFHLPISKLEIDYNAYRSEDHILTDQEVAYLKNDVEIMARALYLLSAEGFNRMTIASQAMSNYQKMVGGKRGFRDIFPIPFNDSFIRKSYKGGFVYVNPKHKEKLVGKGVVIDVNSLYPYTMSGKFLLPYGDPLYYDGQYKSSTLYPLYIQRFTCMFKLKKNHIPMIQIKKNMFFAENEYLTDSKGQILELTLTNIDLEVFLKHYEVSNIKWLDGYMYKGAKDIFKDYVEYYSNMKIVAKKEGNYVHYVIAKLMLNSLYGKLGAATEGQCKLPYLDNGILKFKYADVEEREGIYVAMASFITSYARRETITGCQILHNTMKNGKRYDRYLYSDTDSIHFLCDYDKEDLADILKGLSVDNYKLGSWKIEFYFEKGKYLRQKCYVEYGAEDPGDINKEYNVTISGLPYHLHEYINFDNFKVGLNISDFDLKDKKGKLRPVHVKGGIVLENAKWNIKEFKHKIES